MPRGPRARQIWLARMRCAPLSAVAMVSLGRASFSVWKTVAGPKPSSGAKASASAAFASAISPSGQRGPGTHRGADALQGGGDGRAQRRRDAVHPVIAQDRRDLEDMRVRTPRVAPADAHLDRVVAGEQDRVGASDDGKENAVGERRQAGAAETERVRLVEQPLGLVAGDERHAVRLAEGGERRAGAFVDRIDAGDDERALGLGEGGEGGEGVVERRRVGRRCGERRRQGPHAVARPRDAFHDVDRQVEMHGSRLSVEAERQRLLNHEADRAGPRLEAALDDGAEQRRVVEDLVRVALGCGRRHAAGEEEERHAVLHRVGDHIDRVGDAGAERRDEEARRGASRRGVPALRVPDALCHEAGGVLVLGEDEADAGAVEPLDERQHLAARNAEGVRAAGRAERLAEHVRAAAAFGARAGVRHHPLSSASASQPRATHSVRIE